MAILKAPKRPPSAEKPICFTFWACAPGGNGSASAPCDAMSAKETNAANFPGVMPTNSSRHSRLRSNSIESDHSLEFLFEHDLIRKPYSTFRDHASAIEFLQHGFAK